MSTLIGREELIAQARHRLRGSGPGVLLYGPPGIGKSALLTALLTALLPALVPTPGTALAADPAASATLWCAPAEEDARLPFVGLIDLFAEVPEEHVDALPPTPRAALRAALLRGREPLGAHGRLAVRTAVAEVLRRLAGTGGAVLVVDDLQWLDASSAEVLAFAARRTPGLRVLAAERVPEGGRPERLTCCPPGTAEIAVPPLTDAAITRLLSEQPLPAAALAAVQRTAAGNPLYALELARAAADPDGAPQPHPAVPPRLRAQLLHSARALPAPARDTLLVASAAERPSLTLLRAAGLPGADRELGIAERIDVARADASGAVRFRHPVVRAAVYADATEAERRAAHERLAAAVADPVEQARHLALARPYEDEDTAGRLTAAAHAARRQGDPATAAELAELAARRTPAGRPDAHADRLLAAAEYACDAGRREDAARAAEAVLAQAACARQRVLARLILLGSAGQALGGMLRLIEAGLRDAEGHPELQARLHHWAAVRGFLGGSPAEADAHARRAADRARAAGPAADGTRVAALALLARLRALRGDASSADRALDEALGLLRGTADAPGTWSLIRTGALLAADADRVGDAQEEVAELLAGIGEFAGVEETVATLVALTRIQVRAGRCREAMASAARLPLDSPPALYAAALAESVGGRVDRALDLAERAVAAAEADGDQLFLMRALAVLGEARLLDGGTKGVSGAVEALRRVRGMGEAMGVADPSFLRWHADLAEALVMLGETDAAAETLQAARERTTRQTPASVLAALDRAEGLREAAAGRAKRGVARIQAAADRLRRLPLPVDLARTLIALGNVERRSRRRSTARAALADALAACEAAGAVPLAERAREELARLDAMERGGDGGPALTATEQRVAELVGGGATNREVAAELFISVKTVEGTLSRIYRKFGVRSRTALAHTMAAAVIAAGAGLATTADLDDADRAPVKVSVVTERRQP